MQKAVKDKKNVVFLESLLDVVANVRKTSPSGHTTSWKKVLSEMEARFPNRKLTKESLRNRYRRLTDLKVNQITKVKDDKVAGRTKMEQRVLHEIRRKRPLEWLCERLDATEDQIYASVAKLQRKGYKGAAIYDEDGVVYVHNRIRFHKTIPGLSNYSSVLDLSDDFDGSTVTFAVVSDTHVGNINTAYKELNKFYDIVQERGVKHVLHIGDLTDGYYTHRPTSVLEQDAVGFQNQLRMFVKKYPSRLGVETIAISGNHDYTHLRNGFADIGETIGSIREDITYLGHNFARVKMAPHLHVSMIHPTDGSTENSVKKIKDIINRNPDRRGDIMLIGHYHKVASVFHNDVYGYLVPSFEHKTEFMRDNNLTSEVGGMFITVNLNSRGAITSVNSEVVRL